MLSVHEGSGVGVSKGCNKPLKAGMVISNEPGFYKEGEYGIRLENMMLVCEVSEGFLCFKILTFVSFDESLIDKSMLDKTELSWLEWYHSQCGYTTITI
jgi:Xaa-Pro aminopeptidase